MDGWLALIGAFPVVLFAGLSVLSLLYWVLVMVGAADIDAFDAVSGKAEGAVKGAVEGMADAVAGGVKGGTSAVGEALAALGLSKVPVTITFTAFSLMAFLLSALTRHGLDSLLPGALSALAALGVGVAGGVGAAVGVARPLRGVFADGKDTGGDGLIGKTCKITIDVDGHSGQARVDEIIVPVRIVGGTLARDEEAVIVDRAEDGVFLIEPMRAHVPDINDAFARLQADASSEPSNAALAVANQHEAKK